ncbi:hypothetical protein EJC49_25020 [Aquibium carbonis]|uniref:Uncharacterized protein n=1 Tax=Aquibium carbonis TaxID=2495581 RepID=A0A3R9ZXJ2_9HYPH|nr:hypothetical protein [Aquibium carbonis]RST79595.1 hypothetical protein EJC49_25020 [Aquibium carbonis]
MQVVDIKVTAATVAEDTSLVRFIGEGGDEVAVTIADPHEGGDTIREELVARAKVMLLHAVAAQAPESVAPGDADEPSSEPVEAALPASEAAPDARAPGEPSDDHSGEASDWDADRASGRLAG